MCSKRVIGALGLAAAVSARFWAAAFYSLGQPAYLGTATAIPVISVSIGLMLLAALLSFFGSPSLQRHAAIAFCLAAVLFVGSAAAASQTLLQILAALLVLFSAFGAGSAILAWSGVEVYFSALECGALAAGLGLGLLSHVVLLLGVLHLLYPAVGWGLVAVLLAATRRFIWHGAQVIWGAARGALPDRAAEHLFVLAAVLAFLSIMALQIMAPAIQYDDLHYHLYVPAQQVAARRLVMFPDVPQSFFYQGVEMLYTLAFLVGGETTAIFLNSSFGVLTALALAGFAGRVFSRDAAWLSVLLWTTTPLVAWLMTTGYVDVGAVFFSFLCMIAAFEWMRQANWRLAVLAGALASLAVEAKLNALLFVMALVMTLVTAAWLARRFRDSVRFVAFFSAGALPLGCVWPLVRFVQTGNPVYPFLNGVFRAPGLPFTNDWMNFGTFGMGTGVGALVALPWNVSFHAERFIEGFHPYVLGPCLLLAVAAGIAALPWLQSEIRWATSIAVLYTISWFFRVQYLRYLLPILPLTALIAAAALSRALESLRSGPRSAALTAIGCLLVCPSLVIWFASCFNIPERVPFRVVFGVESRDAFRERVLPVYAALRAVGQACASPSGGVLAIWNEYHYLCPALVPWTAPRAVSIVYRHASDSAYREMLRKLRLDYVVIDDPMQRDHTLPFVSSGFLDRAGELVYQGPGVTAIRLLAPGERQIVQARKQDEGVPYRAGILESVDPTFENGSSPGSPWDPELAGEPIPNAGPDPEGYPPPREGKRALHVSLPGPSGGREGSEASALFPKAAVHVEPGRTYEFSLDLLCSGLYVTPLINLHFTGADASYRSVTRIAANTVCDTTWRRLTAELTVPEGATSLYPEFGFTFNGAFAYARWVELDRLGLVPLSR